MAYAYTVTTKQVGPNEIEITIDETDCGTADIAVVDGVPYEGTVLRVSAQLVSGSATTIDPIASRTTPPASALAGDIVVVPVSTAADVIDRSGYAVYSTVENDAQGLGRIYHSSRCDAGSDNVVQTVYRIRSGSW